MKVRVKIDHDNGYGDTWSKKKGSTYKLPDEHAAALIASGLVEEDKGSARAAPKVAKPKSGTGKTAKAKTAPATDSNANNGQG